MLVFIGNGSGDVDDFMKVYTIRTKVSARARSDLPMLVAGSPSTPANSGTGPIHTAGDPVLKTLNPDLGYWAHPFAMLVMVGTSNTAVNLTDGLDGPAIRPDGRRRRAGVLGVYLHHGGMCGSRSTYNEYISGVGGSRCVHSTGWRGQVPGSLLSRPGIHGRRGVARKARRACTRGALQAGTAPAHRGQPVHGGNPLSRDSAGSYFKACLRREAHFRMAAASSL